MHNITTAHILPPSHYYSPWHFHLLEHVVPTAQGVITIFVFEFEPPLHPSREFIVGITLFHTGGIYMGVYIYCGNAHKDETSVYCISTDGSIIKLEKSRKALKIFQRMGGEMR